MMSTPKLPHSTSADRSTKVPNSTHNPKLPNSAAAAATAATAAAAAATAAAAAGFSPLCAGLLALTLQAATVARSSVRTKFPIRSWGLSYPP